MATAQMSSVLQQVRQTALRQDVSALSDGQLLQQFLAPSLCDGGLREAAFEVLVRRHGPMVLGVCRRVLQNAHDAEDAFQATFLVLVRKASSLLPRCGLGNWLYGVAYHTALKARAQAMKRRTREAQARDMATRDALSAEAQDWQPLLDQELSRLTDKYRAPVVLCDLEGMTRKEAAGRLGVPEGTLSGRLTTARRLLAKRLARHGPVFSAGALAALLSQNAAAACVPAPLLMSTVKAATFSAAGHTAAGVVSAQVASLTEGVLKAMLISKLKVTAAFLLMIGLVALGVGALSYRSLAGDRTVAALEQPATDLAADPDAARELVGDRVKRKDAAPTASGKLEEVDTVKNTVTISTFRRGDGASSKTFALAKDAKIQRDGKDAKLGDLKKGSQATLKLSADEKTVVSLSVASPALSAPLKSVDADKNTITITVGPRGAKEDKTLKVAKEAKIVIDGKDAKLGDLKAGAPVGLIVDDGDMVIQIRSATTRREREKEEE